MELAVYEPRQESESEEARAKRRASSGAAASKVTFVCFAKLAMRTLLLAMLAIAIACSSTVSRHNSHGSTVTTEAAGHAQSDSSSTYVAVSPSYTHEDVLALLRSEGSVLPARPPVHPLHTVYNREAVIPPMCYTRTEGKHNPCYVCHQASIPGRPNTMNDGELQQAYSFSELGQKNHWRNLFEDRSQRVAAISDDAILSWVAQDNYTELAPRLREAGFKGYIPDLKALQHAAEAFDDEGFAKDQSHWVAFNYKPMPSTFWPTNGATDDVMIRLPEAYRNAADGQYARDVYKANLALVEANVKGLKSITVRRIDESLIDADLNGDGKQTKIERITKTDSYVGAAKGFIKLPYLYPQDTEFLHSVRYVGVDEASNVFVPPRMKELRYMRKRFTVSVPQLYEAYQQEKYAKEAGHLPGYIDRGEYGLDNELGWVIAGFVENREGKLRVNNYEENLFCMGCHTSLGSTIDSTFSFVRKVDGAAGWGYVNLHGMPDAPNMGDTKGEFATYLERAGGGGEFRSNPEMEARWFKDGAVDAKKLAAAKDVYELITPSRQRALEMNKAYRVIVEDQDFMFGRDATVSPLPNVYDEIDNDKSPTLPESLTYKWDIRLNWSRAR